MNVGKRIKSLRESAGLTQEALGNKFGRTKQWVSNIETGKTTIDLNVLCALAETFECSVMDILSDDNDNRDDSVECDNETTTQQKEQTMQPSAADISEPESLIKKRESVKTFIDMMDEEQLDVILRFIISGVK